MVNYVYITYILRSQQKKSLPSTDFACFITLSKKIFLSVINQLQETIQFVSALFVFAHHLSQNSLWRFMLSNIRLKISPSITASYLTLCLVNFVKIHSFLS